jgi:SAM-dependent methyltransferase
VPAPEDPPLTRFVSVLNGYQEAAPLIAAHALGIFPEIQKQPQVAADVARHCGSDPRGTEVLLDALVALGLLHRHGATYVLPREIAPYVVPGHAGDATGMIEWAADMYAMWGDLARAVREGSPRVRLTSDALKEGDPARVRRYIRAVHTVSREAAPRLAALAPLLPGSSLLDVGGGSGVFAAEYAQRTPDLRATIFDLPPTLDAAREILETEGYEAMPEFHPGDYRSDPFPGTFDAILLSNVLQTESEENASNLLRKSWESLRPGGTLLVHGMMPEASGSITPAAALFSLRMYLLFDGGRGWSAEQVSEWLARERFGVRAIRALGSPFHSKLIIASRME